MSIIVLFVIAWFCIIFLILPIFEVKIILIERSYEFFVLLFDRLQVDLCTIIVAIRIEIIRKEYSNIIKSFHILSSRFYFLERFI